MSVGESESCLEDNNVEYGDFFRIKLTTNHKLKVSHVVGQQLKCSAI